MGRTIRFLGFWFLLLETIPLSARAQSGIGVNLAAVHDWSTQWVFVDAFRTAREWIPQRVEGGPWDTGERIARTEDGWPLLREGRAAATLLFRDLQGHYPGGIYRVRYAGRGRLEFSFDARIRNDHAGEIELDVHPTNAGILLRIVETDPLDPIRDVRVLMPGFHDADSTGTIFHPLFLERLRPFSTLRFMDWQRTNASELVEFQERSTLETFSQATSRGVALELCIALCNTLRKDAWFCMPHRASDDFVRQFARLVKTKLETNLRVYVEYSNETWNGLFAQHEFTRNRGLRLGLSNDPFQAALRYHARRATEIHAIWEEVFEGRERLVRVLAAQAANPWTATQVLTFEQAWKHADVLAIAPYFGGSLGSGEQAAELVDGSVDQVLDLCLRDLDHVDRLVEEHARIAGEHGLELVAYEAGPHLVGVGPWQSNEALAALFQMANRDARMGSLLRDHVDRWFLGGGSLWMAFTSCERFSRYGSWGLLEWQDQDLDRAPKYRALLAEIEERTPK